ncbi:hypothetical protein niasHT_001240 [Heterodera trifolii]|uniref:ATP-dependent RNA helicase n=1 Tax=Heterodera trifolii TaxID=157864 RepID=A0ABD2M8G0_9BILA
MLANFDCVVQSPTGTGKTLAFMLPTLQILVQKKLTGAGEEKEQPMPVSDDSCRILALVVAPGRDLIVQLFHLFSPLCKKLGISTLKLHGAGGKQKKKSPKKHMKGKCILICTPGSFEHFLEKEAELKQYLKHLEVLVIDEADRYSDRESMSSLTTLLAALPKQRRTALFSATQSSSIEQLLRFGLRNPTRVHMAADTGEVCTDSTGFDVKIVEQNGEQMEEGHQTKGGVVPSELSVYYTCCLAEFKMLALVKFLRSQRSAKVLIFVSTAAQAEYFSLIVPKLLKKDGKEKAEAKERTVLSLHRKMEEKRGKVLELFRTTECSVLFTTDLLARGIDVPNIDWVLHFDIPKLCRLFIHRCGRSARMGRAGRSLLLLMPEEEAYVEYMHNYAGVSMEQCQIETLTEERAVQMRERIQQQAIEDRKILELGSTAFVSYIEAYNRHDCQIICKVKDLNIVGVANAFGLLRMPQIRELRNRADISSAFQPRMDVRTSEIKFKDEKLEAKRMVMLEQRVTQRNEEREKQRAGRESWGDKQRPARENGRDKQRPARENWGDKQKPAGEYGRDRQRSAGEYGRDKQRSAREYGRDKQRTAGEYGRDRQRNGGIRNNNYNNRGGGRQPKFGGRKPSTNEGGRDAVRGNRAQMGQGMAKRGATAKNGVQQQQQNGLKRRVRKAPSEWDQLQKEEGLLRKFRKAKLSRSELNEKMDED